MKTHKGDREDEKDLHLQNKRTNETTESKEQAKIWYEAGDEIEQWYFSEVFGEMICGLEWLH